MKMELSFPKPTGELRMIVTVAHGDWPENRKAVRCEAVWDTGTSVTTFTKRLIDALGLRRLDLPPITQHHPLGDRKAYLYEAWIALKPGEKPIKVIVTEMPQPDTDVLIGMDIISTGRLTLDSTTGETILTFEL